MEMIEKNKNISAQLDARILLLDGAMGTMIQQHELEERDFRGNRFADHVCDLRGNNDLLSLSQPELISQIHRDYLAAGADIIETNTFNATRIAMSDYQLESLVPELNETSARLARWFDETGTAIPIMISGTITDASGRTLSGQTTEAFWNSVRHANPISVGLNCALGPAELRQYVAELSRIADVAISAHPNAGLPNAFGGYDETPEQMAEHLSEWAESGFLNIVGGCCGTTPAHIEAFAKALDNKSPREAPSINISCRLSGLEPCTIDNNSLFVNVGERTNVTGSAVFKRLIVDGDYETALDVARQQVDNGAQIIDINMDEGLLDSEAAMN